MAFINVTDENHIREQNLFLNVTYFWIRRIISYVINSIVYIHVDHLVCAELTHGIWLNRAFFNSDVSPRKNASNLISYIFTEIWYSWQLRSEQVLSGSHVEYEFWEVEKVFNEFSCGKLWIIFNALFQMLKITEVGSLQIT